MDWLTGFIASLFARIFKDWRRDNALKDLGRAEQANSAAAEADRRGNEGDDIDRRLEAMTDAEIDAEADALRGDSR